MYSIPGSGRSPGRGHGNLLQYSYLENPMGIGAWRAVAHRFTESWTQLKQLSMHMHTCIHTADSLCCRAETNNIVKQLYSNKKKFLNKNKTCKMYIQHKIFLVGLLQSSPLSSRKIALWICMWVCMSACSQWLCIQKCTCANVCALNIYKVTLQIPCCSWLYFFQQQNVLEVITYESHKDLCQLFLTLYSMSLHKCTSFLFIAL